MPSTLHYLQTFWTCSHRIIDVKERNNDMKLFGDPFRSDPNYVPETLQLELPVVDIQNDSLMKRAFQKHDLLTFYRHYVSPEAFFQSCQILHLGILHYLAVHIVVKAFL